MVASCWIFCMNCTTMHGSTNSKLSQCHFSHNKYHTYIEINLRYLDMYVFQWSTCYWFSVVIVASLLHHHLLNFSAL